MNRLIANASDVAQTGPSPTLIFLTFLLIAILMAILSFRLIETRTNSAIVIILTENLISILAIREYFNVSQYVNVDFLSLAFFVAFTIVYLGLYILDPICLHKVVETKSKKWLIAYKCFFSSSIESDKKLNIKIVDEIIKALNFTTEEQTVAYKSFLTFSKVASQSIFNFQKKAIQDRPTTFQATFASLSLVFIRNILIPNSNRKGFVNFKCGLYHFNKGTDQLEFILSCVPDDIPPFSGRPLNVSSSFAGYCYENKKPLIHPLDIESTDRRWQERDENKRYKGFYCIPIDDNSIVIIEGINKESVSVLNNLRPLVMIYASICKILLDIAKED